MSAERNTSGENPTSQTTRLQRLGAKFDNAIGPGLSVAVATEYLILHNLAENPAMENGSLAVALFGYLSLPITAAMKGETAAEMRRLRQKVAAKARIIFRRPLTKQSSH